LTEDFIEVWGEPADDALDVGEMFLHCLLSKSVAVSGHATCLPAGGQGHGHIIF